MPQLILYGTFLFALGACVGSFLNVVIWRLRLSGHEVSYHGKTGKLSLSWPPSHCPVCDSSIRWYQNIPILAWILLRAKCANCKTTIPIRYPMVELATASIYLAFFLAYFVGQWWGNSAFLLPPEPHLAFLALVPLLLHLTLVSALLAASAIDADWYIIPLSIPVFLCLLGTISAPLINHPVIPTLNLQTQWPWAKPILGATVGLILANILLALKILPLSFANLPEKPAPKEETPSKQIQNPKSKIENAKEDSLLPLPKLTRIKPILITVLAILIALAATWVAFTPKTASLLSVCGAILIFLLGVLPRDADQADVTDEVLEEISVPQARHEILKELLFLLVPLACAALAFVLPFDLPQSPWLARLLGSLLGLLVGGGVVWLVRIGGTLGFGREAMGLGDVHLMAGVGAVIGAPLALIAFITAPFLGLLWAGFRTLLGKPHVLPYGPWLSVASILCLLVGNPLLNWYLTFFMGPTVSFPPAP